jgi:hypothetical protein
MDVRAAIEKKRHDTVGGRCYGSVKRSASCTISTVEKTGIGIEKLSNFANLVRLRSRVDRVISAL